MDSVITVCRYSLFLFRLPSSLSFDNRKYYHHSHQLSAKKPLNITLHEKMSIALLDRLTRHLPTSWSSWESRTPSVNACYKKSKHTPGESK